MVMKGGDGEVPASKSTFYQAMPQFLAIAVKNILLLAFGLTLGFPTILIPGLTDPDESFDIGKEGLTWIGSINLICVPIGCLISGGVSQAVGRKRAMQIVNLPFVTAWLLFYFSSEEWQVFLALALTGLTGGFLEAPVLTYAAEISQPHLRGMLSSMSSMSVILGVMVMFLFGTFFHWRNVALVCCIFNVFSVVLLFFIPESPHWLISKNRLLDARKSLAWLRGWTTLDAIEPEYKQIYREVKNEHDEGLDNPAFDGNMNDEIRKAPTAKKEEAGCCEVMKLFGKKNFLWPYALTSYVFFLAHYTGMSTLQTYAVQIFVTLKAPIDKYYATMTLGVVELLGTVVNVVAIHWLGKRVLIFISLMGMGVCYVAVATYAFIYDINTLYIPEKDVSMQNDTGNSTIADFLRSDDTNQYTWLPMVLLITYAFLAHMGLRVIPWILTAELFPNEIRAASSGFCSATSYIFNFSSNKIFFYMIGAMTLPGTLWFYSSMAFLGLVILYFLMPETEGKTLGEITEHFNGGKKMGNHVFRGHGPQESAVTMGTINNGYVTDAQNKYESKL